MFPKLGAKQAQGPTCSQGALSGDPWAWLCHGLCFPVEQQLQDSYFCDVEHVRVRGRGSWNSPSADFLYLQIF